MSGYLKEIETVLHCGVVIGYRCRAEVLFGVVEIPSNWLVTPCIKSPKWMGRFKTRSEARDFLITNYENKEND